MIAFEETGLLAWLPPGKAGASALCPTENSVRPYGALNRTTVPGRYEIGSAVRRAVLRSTGPVACTHAAHGAPGLLHPPSFSSATPVATMAMTVTGRAMCRTDQLCRST